MTAGKRTRIDSTASTSVTAVRWARSPGPMDTRRFGALGSWLSPGCQRGAVLRGSIPGCAPPSGHRRREIVMERSKGGDLPFELRQLLYAGDSCCELALRHTPRVEDFLDHDLLIRIRLVPNESQRTPQPNARRRIGTGRRQESLLNEHCGDSPSLLERFLRAFRSRERRAMTGYTASTLRDARARPQSRPALRPGARCGGNVPISRHCATRSRQRDDGSS